MINDYTEQRIALLTQHGKERVIAQVMDAALGCRVEHVAGFDTDRLGTFTRDIPRPGSQLEAARKKARIGMDLAGLSLGLASEGSFSPDPFTGMFPWNVELLVFIDDRAGLEIVGAFQGPGKCSQSWCEDWSAVETFARQAGFPEHHLVLRPGDENDSRVRKGIASWPALEAAFMQAKAETAGGRVFVEHDLRAHAHPARMDNIRRAAEDLAQKLLSICPDCGAPGFWGHERLDGLPCADCGAPTRETRAVVWACVRCDHRETRDLPDATAADPGRCDYCNP